MLVTALHAFTHVYHLALMPLYLPMVRDLGFPSVERATVLVSIMMIAYYVPSYPMGILADRVSAKGLLGWGLVINGLGFIGLSFSHSFGQAALGAIVTGLGGSFFHPAATAMLARLYSDARGRALGISATGASLGFVIGPLYAGWRGDAAGWRAPVLELGIAGIVMAMLFMWLADDAHHARTSSSSARSLPFPGLALVGAFLLMAFFFALRDFGGSGNATLSSLFLQQAHGDSVEGAGRVLSVLFIMSIISSPLFGHLSDKRRLATAAALIFVSAAALAVLPFVSRPAFPYCLALFGFFFMASYPVVEAGLMELLPDAFRGRAFGLFITVGGITGNLSHWAVGIRVRELGDAAHRVGPYISLYGGLAAMIAVSVCGLLVLKRLRQSQQASLGWFSHFSTPRLAEVKQT